jgi:hypothetical protein
MSTFWDMPCHRSWEAATSASASFVHSLASFVHSLASFVHPLASFVHPLASFVHSLASFVHSLFYLLLCNMLYNAVQFSKKCARGRFRNYCVQSITFFAGEMARPS